MKTAGKIGLSVLAAFVILAAGIGIGSVPFSPQEILCIMGNRLFGLALPQEMEELSISILWDIRLPRALLAFLAGSALAASGTVMQSVLKNPLASSYTLGVSSGASLGAAAIMVSGLTIPFLGMFTLPTAGFLSGLATVFLALGFASRIDRKMENQTVILVGMVLSLFVNALLTTITALSREHLQQMVFWQMGSFSGRDWSHVGLLCLVTVLGIACLMCFTREMDIMTFGEEQAVAVGVNVKRVKLILIGLSALLTGTTVSFVGVIGFVDLIAPHVVRKIFGASHRLVLPLSALFGGAFMVLADLISRTVLSPSELPVGAVTALVGAPFFAFVFFSHRKKS